MGRLLFSDNWLGCPILWSYRTSTPPASIYMSDSSQLSDNSSAKEIGPNQKSRLILTLGCSLPMPFFIACLLLPIADTYLPG